MMLIASNWREANSESRSIGARRRRSAGTSPARPTIPMTAAASTGPLSQPDAGPAVSA